MSYRSGDIVSTLEAQIDHHLAGGCLRIHGERAKSSECEWIEMEKIGVRA